jgi:glucose/arabinose dehydrogenase
MLGLQDRVITGELSRKMDSSRGLLFVRRQRDSICTMKHLQAMRSVLAAALLCVSALSQAAIQLIPVVSSGLSSPIFVGNAGDGSHRLFIVEQGGVIRVLQPSLSVPTVFLDIHTRVLAGGERGLLGLAFHPQYASNGRFFVYYTRPVDGAIVIAEYGVSATRTSPTPTRSCC